MLKLKKFAKTKCDKHRCTIADCIDCTVISIFAVAFIILKLEKIIDNIVVTEMESEME